MASGSGAGDADEIKILETKVVILGNTGVFVPRAWSVTHREYFCVGAASRFCVCVYHSSPRINIVVTRSPCRNLWIHRRGQNQHSHKIRQQSILALDAGHDWSQL